MAWLGYGILVALGLVVFYYVFKVLAHVEAACQSASTKHSDDELRQALDRRSHEEALVLGAMETYMKVLQGSKASFDSLLQKLDEIKHASVPAAPIAVLKEHGEDVLKPLRESIEKLCRNGLIDREIYDKVIQESQAHFDQIMQRLSELNIPAAPVPVPGPAVAERQSMPMGMVSENFAWRTMKKENRQLKAKYEAAHAVVCEVERYLAAKSRIPSPSTGEVVASMKALSDALERYHKLGQELQEEG